MNSLAAYDVRVGFFPYACFCCVFVLCVVSFVLTHVCICVWTCVYVGLGVSLANTDLQRDESNRIVSQFRDFLQWVAIACPLLAAVLKKRYIPLRDYLASAWDGTMDASHLDDYIRMRIIRHRTTFLRGETLGRFAQKDRISVPWFASASRCCTCICMHCYCDVIISTPCPRDLRHICLVQHNAELTQTHCRNLPAPLFVSRHEGLNYRKKIEDMMAKDDARLLVDIAVCACSTPLLISCALPTAKRARICTSRVNEYQSALCNRICAHAVSL